LLENDHFPNDHRVLNSRLIWLVRFRWIAIIGVLSLVSLLSYLEIISQLDSIIKALVVLGVINLLFFVLMKHDFKLKWLGFNGFCFLQIFVDIMAVLVLAHFTGGIVNPFIFFLVAPILVATFCFQNRSAYFMAGLALFLACLLGYLESAGVVQSYETILLKKT